MSGFLYITSWQHCNCCITYFSSGFQESSSGACFGSGEKYSSMLILPLSPHYSQLWQHAGNLTEFSAIAKFTTRTVSNYFICLNLCRNFPNQISNVALRSKNNYFLYGITIIIKEVLSLYNNYYNLIKSS